MQTVDVEKPLPYGETVITGDALIESLVSAPRDAADILFDLWAWTSGLKSFLHTYDRAIGENGQPTAVTRSRIPEFELTSSALFRISALLAELNRLEDPAWQESAGISKADLARQTAFVNDFSVLNNALLKGKDLGFAEWRTWKGLMYGRIAGLDSAQKLDAASRRLALHFLPAPLKSLPGIKDLKAAERVSLEMVTLRLSRILRSLRIISRMLREDEPLKPTLLIFCSIYEQIRSMTEDINATLSRSGNEGDEIFGLMDGASYMATLELKKAYNQELTGIIGIRSAPAVFARVESAYALLNDSFQEILTGFARLADPNIGTSDLFPEFQHKLTESLLLRSHLSQALAAVQAAEQSPTKEQIASLKELLKSFLSEPVEFLFYKDRESVERFCEEIHAAGEKKDLVPILHRFAAYLETLFRQVSMRTVLSNHPFEAEN